MALVKEYFRLTQNYKNEYGERTILLYQVGAFFEVYGLQDKSSETIIGSQITEFCRICDLNLANKNMEIEGVPVMMAGFSHYMLDKYLKRLQEEGYTAVVYKQEEHDKTTRSLFGIFSPGTYFAEDNQQMTNNTICIWLELTHSMLLKKKQLHVGMSNINIYTGECSLFEYHTDYVKSPTTYDELERFVSIYHPSEVILISSLSLEENEDVISFANIECKSIHMISLETNDSKEKKGEDREKKEKEKETDMKTRAINSQKQTYQSSILQRFFGIDHIEQQQNYYQHTIALQSLCFLLDFIHQHNPYLVRKIKEPIFENCSERLLLANHSLKQLNIIGSASESKGKYSSVERMLNICLTPMGRRKFSYHLLHPTTNIEYLQEEYDIIEHVLSHYEEYHPLFKPALLSMKDISKLHRLSVMKRISPKSLGQIHQNLRIVREISVTLSSDKKEKNRLFETYLKKRIPSYENIPLFCDKLIGFLESQLDMQSCQSIDHFSQFETNFILPGVDAELDEKISLYESSLQKLNTIIHDFNNVLSKYEKERKTTASKKTGTGSSANDYVKLHETEKNSISIISTKRRCEILKKAIDPSMNLAFHHQSASNESITSPQIAELCSNISAIKIALKDIIGKVYFNILERFQDHQADLETIIEYITLLDLVYAKATLAKTCHYCKPVISKRGTEKEKSFVDAKQIRHPLIERIQHHELYVANDLSLGSQEQKGILLYGVNMVGKTSLIKSIGIGIIMAQAGMYVPASSFVYYPYKHIFTRILNNDNLFKGLSTFAVEMTELRTILKMADERSIILGDEIASGSETTSGISIFVAALRNLYAKQSSFVFATHMHEIVEYEEIKEMVAVKIQHLEVEYDREKDMLVYNRVLKEGSGSRLYGLEVAKYLKLPDDFLEDANALRIKYFCSPGSAGSASLSNGKAEETSILSLKTSHYNRKKLVGLCEVCGEKMGTEVHHLQHQRVADDQGIIHSADGSSLFHKNHAANLVSICSTCHDNMHHTTIHDFHSAGPVPIPKKKKKTTKGIVLSA